MTVVESEPIWTTCDSPEAARGWPQAFEQSHIGKVVDPKNRPSRRRRSDAETAEETVENSVAQPEGLVNAELAFASVTAMPVVDAVGGNDDW